MKIEVEDYQDFVSDEVYQFLKSLEQISDFLLELSVSRTSYGYFIRGDGKNAHYLWELELRLYESSSVKRISYVMIQYFQVSCERQGYGVDLFNKLKDCLKFFKDLKMIRLESRDEIGKHFWIGKNGFRLKGEPVEWIKGNTKWVDIDCLEKPAELNVYRYIYDVNRCECASCLKYYEEKRQS